jgi:hypothetical protein
MTRYSAHVRHAQATFPLTLIPVLIAANGNSNITTKPARKRARSVEAAERQERRIVTSAEVLDTLIALKLLT